MVSIMGGRPSVKSSDSTSKDSLTIDNEELGREQEEAGDESIAEKERMDGVTKGASSSQAKNSQVDQITYRTRTTSILTSQHVHRELHTHNF